MLSPAAALIRKVIHERYGPDGHLWFPDAYRRRIAAEFNVSLACVAEALHG